MRPIGLPCHARCRAAKPCYLPLYVRSLKPAGSSKVNVVLVSTVDVAAVEASASKLNLEKRLFRLNVPTVSSIAVPTLPTSPKRGIGTELLGRG